MNVNFELRGDITDPLALLIHGRGGNIDIMRIFIRSLPEKWNLLFVEAPYKDKLLNGLSWWDATKKPTPWDEIESSMDGILTALDETITEHGLSPQSTIGLGFSQGSAILSLLALTNPTRFRAIAILAGFVLLPKVLPSFTPETSVFWSHGEEDEIIPLSRAEEGRVQLEELGYTVKFVTEPVGHKIGTAGMRELKDWLSTV